MSLTPLTASQLRRRCQFPEGGFTTTDDLAPLNIPLGQERALEAIELGIHIDQAGYNLFVTGSLGVGKHKVVDRALIAEAHQQPVPLDYCYVNNFDKPDQPNAIALPAGSGKHLRDDMLTLVERLLETVPDTFQADEYRNRVQELHDEFQDHEQQLMEEFADRARQEDVALMRTPMGFTLGPIKNDDVISAEEFNKLDKAEQEKIEKKIERLNAELRSIMQQIPKLQEESRSRIQQVNQEFAHVAVDPLMAWMHDKWQHQPEVLDYLAQVDKHILENLTNFLNDKENHSPLPVNRSSLASEFKEYTVNLLVDNSEHQGAPIVYEENPTYQNLLGRIEHTAEMGTLTTNFTLIKPGALHTANGGYLILDARRLLTQPFAWDGLKRALRTRELRLENLQDYLSLTTTTSLEPEPIPLNVKIILCGERLLYFLLKEHDPEFDQLFKVQADFNEDYDWTTDNLTLYSRLIAGLVKHHQLMPFDAPAVAAVIEQAARQVEDREKLTLNMMKVTDLLTEANYWAQKAQATQVNAAHVHTAIAKRRYRHGQIREHMGDNIRRQIVNIDTAGTAMGQANGLAVFRLGDEWFGKPNRITATARPGSKGILDIERETDLGGPIHSKGVMILSSYLAQKYGRQTPIALTASIVFEQSYGPVDGDSASAVELCTLLSAIGEIPLKQAFAVTGSVNQHGDIQAIGGVNEKIEGFFETCQLKPADETQGVIIPSANVQHLMLSQAVIDACEQGQFAIYAVATIDQLISLLSGLDAGDMQTTGDKLRYPADSINGRVQQQLQRWYHLLRHQEDDKSHRQPEA